LSFQLKLVELHEIHCHKSKEDLSLRDTVGYVIFVFVPVMLWHPQT